MSATNERMGAIDVNTGSGYPYVVALDYLTDLQRAADRAIPYVVHLIQNDPDGRRYEPGLGDIVAEVVAKIVGELEHTIAAAPGSTRTDLRKKLIHALGAIDWD